jgi:glycosyltransferase involved in cell wall biosynthesis
VKTAIVHYWWLVNRGGEAVVRSLAQLHPDADLFVHVGDEKLMRAALGPSFRGRIHQTFISRLPGARRHYQKYLPLMPMASEQLDMTPYDLVLSSEAGPAKGVVTRPDAVHLCYCHSPMRYVWDLYHDYSRAAGGLTSKLFAPVAHYMRIVDRLGADRVDRFVANSHFVAGRVRKYWRRDAEVVHPPVEVSSFSPRERRGPQYLLLGQLVPYKRADLAVQAFTELGLPLVVVGDGPERAALARHAGRNVELLGPQPFDVVRELLQTCRALVFPGVEDFGIVPVEAMAAGAPVIAFGQGGALETVQDGLTGTFFHQQSVAALKEAVLRVESGRLEFDPLACHARARQFDAPHFRAAMAATIEDALAVSGRGPTAGPSAGLLTQSAPVLRHADVDEAAVQRSGAERTLGGQAGQHVAFE